MGQENGAESRMAAAAAYYESRWGTPVPEMTPRFTELVIARWFNDARRGIVEIPAETRRILSITVPTPTQIK